MFFISYSISFYQSFVLKIVSFAIFFDYSTVAVPEKSIHFTHKNWPVLYALAHINLRILRMGAAGFFSYDEFMQEQDVPEHKTTIKRSDTRIVKQDRSHA